MERKIFDTVNSPSDLKKIDSEHIEPLCEEIRDLAIIELLTSTGMRVGEVVNLNIEDINFYERECFS